MQNRFVGDIGDFGKYGLLRALTGIYPEEEPRLSLGVVWYVPDEETIQRTPQSYGNNIGYLNKQDQFRSLDPKLYDCLAEIVRSGRRSLKSVEQSGILGNTAFHEASTTKGGESRKKWMDYAIKHTTGKKIIFLDPDTGIAPRSMPMGRKDSPKYTYPNEIHEFLNHQQTVVIYQHCARDQKGRVNQMNQWKSITKKIYRIPRILATSQRAFIIFPTPDYAPIIDKRLHDLERRWGSRFFQLVL